VPPLGDARRVPLREVGRAVGLLAAHHRQHLAQLREGLGPRRPRHRSTDAGCGQPSPPPLRPHPKATQRAPQITVREGGACRHLLDGRLSKRFHPQYFVTRPGAT
jgi:hypothetical protein